MTGDELQRRRDRLADASAEAARRVQHAWEERGERPAEPGDLYVLAASAVLPVEWALIERHPDQRQLFLAVPADTGPVLESADVAVAEAAACGPLTLRCRAKTWLSASVLVPDLYAGTLPPEARQQARQVLHQLETESTQAAVEGGAAEYRDWMREVITPARAAVSALPPLSLASRRPRPLRLLAAAACILLLVNLSLLGWAVRQKQRITALAAERTAAAESLTRERAQTESLRRRLSAAERAGEETAKVDRGLRQRIAEMEGRLGRAMAPMLNPPLAFLDPVGALRGAAQTIRLPADSSFLFVVLQLDEEPSPSEYRLSLIRRDDSRLLWRSKRLTGPLGDEIRLALPRPLLSPGEYRLRLDGSRSGRADPLAEFELQIAP